MTYQGVNPKQELLHSLLAKGDLTKARIFIDLLSKEPADVIAATLEKNDTLLDVLFKLYPVEKNPVVIELIAGVIALSKFTAKFTYNGVPSIILYKIPFDMHDISNQILKYALTAGFLVEANKFLDLLTKQPPAISDHALHDNDTALDILFAQYAAEQDTEAPNPKRIRQIIDLIAKVVDLSRYSAKLKFNDFVMRVLESIPFDYPDLARQKMRQAILDQGGHTVAIYANEISRAGHILGITTAVEFETDDGDIFLRKSEGGYIHNSMSWFAKLIEEYCSSVGISPQIRTLIERFESGLLGKDPELKIIPTGYPKHAVYLATLGDEYLILSNRGDRYSPNSGGVKIFKIKPGTTIKLESVYASPKAFEDAIAAIVDLNQPLHTFMEVKSQLIGNCSFANLKGLITPYLYLALPEKAGKNEKHERKSAQDLYKLLTNWMRTHEVDRLISALKSAHNDRDEEKEKFYSGILIRYVVAASLKDRKRSSIRIEADSKRALQILELLDALGTYKPFLKVYFKYIETFEDANLAKGRDAAKQALGDYLRQNPLHIKIQPGVAANLTSHASALKRKFP